VFIDWTEVDHQPDVIFGEQMIWFTFRFWFAPEEAGAHELDIDIVLLWNAQYLLVGEIITHSLM
jgi:hypothetical protein